MLNMSIDIEVIEDSLTDIEVTCEHTRHPFDPAWHDEGNGLWDVLVFCESCPAKALVFCSGYVEKRIRMYPNNKVWCPTCKSRMTISESYQVIGRIS